MDPLVADIVSTLDPNLREDFEERAAIMEFDANLGRAHAECLALIDLLHRHPAVLTGVTVMQVDVDSTIQYWLVTDLESVRNINGVEIGMGDLVRIIDQQYSGIARLAP